MLSLVDNKKLKIISFFLEHPTEEIHLRALARKLKISPTWITKILNSLVKARLVITRKRENVLMIKSNRDSNEFKRLKISSNLYRIHESGLWDALIDTYNKPECILIFGSFRRGEDTEKSDIDLAVITSKNINKDWSKFERKLDRKIKIQELKKEKIEPEFMNTLSNGIILYGYLEVR
ncbi:MAG: nucleotidyltransferase domain-containing protein [Candidatus Woesearchaeota archaeon]